MGVCVCGERETNAICYVWIWKNHIMVVLLKAVVYTVARLREDPQSYPQMDAASKEARCGKQAWTEFMAVSGQWALV